MLALTNSGSAKPILDYLPDLDLVRFAPGETSKTLTVGIVGDRKPEANETFEVRLKVRLGPASIVDGTGVGTIIDDD